MNYDKLVKLTSNTPITDTVTGFKRSDRIGDILVNQNIISQRTVNKALNIQTSHPDKLGKILIAEGWASETAVCQALSKQQNLRWVDLTQTEVDHSLVTPADIDVYVQYKFTPWQKIGKTIIYAGADPDLIRKGIEKLTNPSAVNLIVLTNPSMIETAIEQLFRQHLTRQASELTPERFSTRIAGKPIMRILMSLCILSAAIMVITFGARAITYLTIGIAIFSISAIILRIFILAAATRPEKSYDNKNIITLHNKPTIPSISLLIPLYREDKVLPILIKALNALKYPRSKLNVILLVEEADIGTIDSLIKLSIPAWMRVITVPTGHPRTKPRAMNYALQLCDSDIIGIYDAEDQPDPNQLLKVADAHNNAAQNVACFQARLGYYNPKDSWLSRCFTIEYAIWFDLLLTGLKKLSLPIPLGGTSVFFRRKTLIKLGGWDAHNVTEDADLGIRIARQGWEVELIDSTTNEEASTKVLQWIKQRSRWIKGYMQVWFTHSRNPIKLYKDLGLKRFVAFQVMILGSVISYLGQPIFWACFVHWALVGEILWTSYMPSELIWPMVIALALGQVFMLVFAAIGAIRCGKSWLLKWCLTLPIYWPLGGVASYKALYETVFAPFYWDKTMHGDSNTAKELRKTMAQEDETQ